MEIFVRMWCDDLPSRRGRRRKLSYNAESIDGTSDDMNF